MNKFVTGLLTAAMFSTMILTAQALEFDDVSTQTDYYDSIEWMSEQGVINGYGDGSFGPDNCVRRAEMLKMLFEMLEIDETTASYTDKFSDIPEGEWFTDYVMLAYERGTVQGYEDGTFRPADCVTRAEAIKMTFEEFQISSVPAEGAGYTIDIEKDDWFFGYVLNADRFELIGKNHGWTEEEDYPTFHYYPNGEMSRKEVAELLFRSKAVVDNDETVYQDSLEPWPIVAPNLQASCVKEGESLGALSPDNDAVCCEGLIPEVDEEVEGRKGVCVMDPELEYLTFASELLAIEFDYPASWGTITEYVESEDHMFLSVNGDEDSSHILLGADSDGESIGRGAYFGDAAELITDEEYVTGICEEKTEALSCEVKTSENLISYAKVNEVIFDFGGDYEVTQYYIFNPYSDYRGIILSDQRVSQLGDDNTVEIIDGIVESLRFILE